MAKAILKLAEIVLRLVWQVWLLGIGFYAVIHGWSLQWTLWLGMLFIASSLSELRVPVREIADNLMMVGAANLRGKKP